MANWGSISEILAACAGFTASGAALYVAGADRRRRKREDAEGALAEARFVLVAVEPPQGDYGFIIRVENHGSQPVLDVAFETATMAGHPQAEALQLPSDEPHPPEPILLPGQAPVTFRVLLRGPGSVLPMGERITDSHGNWSWPDADPDKVQATVQFTDSGGRRWRRTGTDVPRRVHS
ncbi:hypothetical protein ACIGO9_26765 [Nocardia asteroides]|uniref:hypothetical protein n=1 Tax=Nocardia asteroides TaxID=1824 RepID=UPI0037CC06B6